MSECATLAPAGVAADRIEHRDRIFVTGATDTGKSIIARSIFLGIRSAKAVLDPTDSELCSVPGERVVRDVRRVDFSTGIVRYVPQDVGDREELDAFYVAIGRLPGPFWVWDDECRFACPATGTGPGARRYIVTLRKREMGGCWANTRPVDVFKECKGAAKHIISTALYNDADRTELCAHMSLPRDVLDAAYAELAPHGFLWWHVRTRELQICNPLPWP